MRQEMRQNEAKNGVFTSNTRQSAIGQLTQLLTFHNGKITCKGLNARLIKKNPHAL